MAKDVAQRDLDQANNRITNLGDPKAAGDATKTDNATAPKAASGGGSPGTSLLASPADHVHPLGSSVGVISVEDASYQTVTGSNEELVSETVIDLDAVPGTELTMSLSAAVKASTGTATYQVRLGGTPGNVDGTVALTMTSTATTFTPTRLHKDHLANPGGQQLLKITAHGDSAAAVAHIYGKSVQLRPQTA